MSRLRRSHVNAVVILYVVLFSALIFFSIRQIRITEQGIKRHDKESDEIFAHLFIEAKAAYVLDTTNGKMLYGKNEHVPLPIASITKIATAICTLDTFSPKSIAKVDVADLDNEWNGLKAGDEWYIDDLITFMLIESSNNAAKTLARAYGGEPAMVSCMNKLAQRLKLYDTKFANVTGLDVGEYRGAYGSATDVAKLLENALLTYPDIFGKTSYKSYNVVSVNGREYKAVNTDRAIDDIPALLASKTGYTEIAGGNLVFAMNAGLNHKVIIAILGSSEDGRFKDAVTLSHATIEALSE